MNKSGISLGRILGISVALDYSWFLIFALVTWSLASSYYPAEFPNWPAAQYWVVGGLTAILLFASVLLHELAHSLVARRYGTPVSSITLYIFGGVSQLDREPPSATAEFWMALAGPGTSIALAVLFVLLQPLAAVTAPLLALVRYLAYINGSLAVFNLIPGFPLDGGRVLRAVLWGTTRSLGQATRIAATVGRFIAYLFILGGVWMMLTGDLGNGLWIAFIGWFLESAASSHVRQQGLQDVLAGHKVTEVMNRDYAAIPAGTSLQELVDRHILAGGKRSFVVMQDGQMLGLVTLHCIKETPRDDWPLTTAAQCMIPAAQVKRVRPDAELWAALDEMQRDGVNQLPVMTDGQIVGMLSRDDIISFIGAHRELGLASH